MPSVFTSRQSARHAQTALSTIEALANELAARFYAVRGFEKIAVPICGTPDTAISVGEPTARCGNSTRYIRTSGKEEPPPGPTSTIGAPVDQLDLATVIKVSQAVSGEIVLEKLLDDAHAHRDRAGGGRARPVDPMRAGLSRGSSGSHDRRRHGRRASARRPRDGLSAAGSRSSTTSCTPERASFSTMPRPRTTFAADPYIRQRQARSILCLPLITQAKLIGVLYLENNLAPRVFAPGRIAVLKLLASQAAIALENTRLVP